MTLEAHTFLIHFREQSGEILPLRFWTGRGDLDFQDEKWTAIGGAIQFGDLGLTVGLDAPALEFSITLESPELKRIALEQSGAGDHAEVQWIVSDDEGMTWRALMWKLRGRISSPELSGNTFSGSLERRITNITRGRPEFWSADSQRLLRQDDKAADGMAQLARGFTINWPP